MLIPVTPLNWGPAPTYFPWWQFKDFFYRGLFSKALELVQNEIYQSPRDGLFAQLCQVPCLIELCQLDQASAKLQEIQGELKKATSTGLHPLAASSLEESDFWGLTVRIQYLEAILLSRKNCFSQSMELFVQIIEIIDGQSQSRGGEPENLTILSTIGSLFIALELGNDESANYWYQILSLKEPSTNPDIRIQSLLAQSLHALIINKDSQLSLNLAKKSFSEAMSQSWTYFAVLSMMMIALGHQREKNTRELQLILDFLQLMIEDSEFGYILQHAFQKFKDARILKDPIEFDMQNKRVFIGGTWLPLHERPILFEFLKLLRQREDFLDKRSIAEALWPMEPYKSRVHDPRIFDIAKRARTITGTHPHHPVALLSGRMGYKLSVH